MDTEDRDHFKTIASRLPELREGSPKQQSAANSASGQFQAFCLKRARLLFACYRKDETHDPEIYAAAAAAMLSVYPRQVVDRATDPRIGIASESKWLPSVAEIREFCDRQTVRLARMAEPPVRLRGEPLPRPQYRPGESYFEMIQKRGRPLGPFETIDDKWNRGRQRAEPLIAEQMETIDEAAQ